MKKRTIIGILSALLTLIIVTVAVSAAVIATKPVSGSVTVVASSNDIKLYSDAACTVELTTMDWGTVKQGFQSNTKFIYVKNIGDFPMTYLSSTNTLPVDVGTVATGNLTGTLAPGTVRAVTTSLLIPLASTLGSADFTLNIIANQ
jgi:hypothetical protein